MAANSKKLINFLSAGLRRHQKHAKHGRFRPFRAVPRGLGLRQATKHLKRYNYGFDHLCLRFLLSRNGRLPTEYFWHVIANDVVHVHAAIAAVAQIVALCDGKPLPPRYGGEGEEITEGVDFLLGLAWDGLNHHVWQGLDKHHHTDIAALETVVRWRHVQAASFTVVKERCPCSALGLRPRRPILVPFLFG